MATINETLNYPSEWLKGEDQSIHRFSREDVTILAGSGSDRVLKSGMVLGKITATGKYVQLNTAGADGSQNAAGILFLDTTAPNGVDKRAAIIARKALVSDNGIKWPAGISGPQIATATAQLIALGILVREGV
jgi:hypothetical protein